MWGSKQKAQRHLRFPRRARRRRVKWADPYSRDNFTGFVRLILHIILSTYLWTKRFTDTCRLRRSSENLLNIRSFSLPFFFLKVLPSTKHNLDMRTIVDAQVVMLTLEHFSTRHANDCRHADCHVYLRTFLNSRRRRVRHTMRRTCQRSISHSLSAFSSWNFVRKVSTFRLGLHV